MAPLNSPYQCSLPSFFTPQMFFNRDLWLHALALPSALVQHLFYKEYSDVSTPFRLPAERCPHLRTLMAWPEETRFLNGDELDHARQEVASIANAVSKYEPVWMYASRIAAASATSRVGENVTIVDVDVEQPWLRDTGPVLVTSTSKNEVVGIDFNFNYFGANFARPSGWDRTLPYRMLAHQNLTRTSASMSAEGGALEVDGKGTLLATESSLLGSDHNGEYSKAGMEDTFRELLGVKKTIWLEGLLQFDSTDYHVDRLARFGPSSTVILSRPHKLVPHDDARWEAYKDARFVLSTSTNADDAPFEIVEIEDAALSPGKNRDSLMAGMEDTFFEDDQRQAVFDSVPNTFEEDDAAVDPANDSRRTLSAATSYLSFYLVNGGVIVPQFGDPATDQVAIDKIQEVFPDRTIEPLMLQWMPQVGEGLHGATLQWPSPGTTCC